MICSTIVLFVGSPTLGALLAKQPAEPKSSLCRAARTLSTDTPNHRVVLLVVLTVLGVGFYYSVSCNKASSKTTLSDRR